MPPFESCNWIVLHTIYVVGHSQALGLAWYHGGFPRTKPGSAGREPVWRNYCGGQAKFNPTHHRTSIYHSQKINGAIC